MPVSGMTGEAVDVQILLREIRGMRKELQHLTEVVSKDKIYDTWIDETTAAKMVGLKPQVFRKKVKGEELKIAYRNTNGRAFQYNRRDIKKFLDNTSTN